MKVPVPVLDQEPPVAFPTEPKIFKETRLLQIVVSNPANAVGVCRIEIVKESVSCKQFPFPVLVK